MILPRSPAGARSPIVRIAWHIPVWPNFRLIQNYSVCVFFFFPFRKLLIFFQLNVPSFPWFVFHDLFPFYFTVTCWSKFTVKIVRTLSNTPHCWLKLENNSTKQQSENKGYECKGKGSKFTMWSINSTACGHVTQ